MKIISYVVRRDYGFAPNPFFEYCTLATCKPDIRKSASVGDWVIGTSSISTGSRDKLVFAMKVTEKLTFNEYWYDKRFINKRPILNQSRKFQYGDNIYHKEGTVWIQLPSHHSEEDGSSNYKNIATDTKADYVLVSNHFYYFGRDSVSIPSELSGIIKVGPSCKYVDKVLHDHFLNNFIQKFSLGVHGSPFAWKGLHQKRNLQLVLSL